MIRIICILLALGLASEAYSQDADSKVAIDTSEYIPGDLNFNLLVAAQKSYTQEIKRLIEKGAKINSASYEGVTALMYSVDNENLEAVLYLLEKGGDPNILPENGFPALTTAVKWGNLELAEILIRNGAQVDIQGWLGRSPIHYAAAYNMSEILDMLIYYEADVNIRDENGNSPILIASYYKNIESIEILMENGALVNMADQLGNTPLHISAQMNDVELAKLLIQKGATIDTTNQYGKTPLAIAIEGNHYAASKFLLDTKADPNYTAKNSSYPLNIAKEARNDSLILLLKQFDATSSKKVNLNQVSVSTYLSNSANDAMPGIGISFDDDRYDVSIETGFFFRAFAKRILEEKEANIYYQYWENRAYFYLKPYKRLEINTFTNKQNLTAEIGAKALYTYGRYRGTDQKPQARFHLAPYGGINYNWRFVGLGISYEYLDFDLHKVSPGRIQLGIHFRIPTNNQAAPSLKSMNYL